MDSRYVYNVIKLVLLVLEINLINVYHVTYVNIEYLMVIDVNVYKVIMIN